MLPSALHCLIQSPEYGIEECGSVTAYRKGCHAQPCRNAWKKYKEDKYFRVGRVPRTYAYPHGTPETARAGCTCRPCDNALRYTYYVRDAEDAVFADEDRVSNRKLRNHGTAYAYSRRKCRCPECTYAVRMKRARQRGRAMVPYYREFDALLAERRARVTAYLEARDEPTYDDVAALIVT